MTEEMARYLVGVEGRERLAHVAQMPGDAPSRVLALRNRGVDGLMAGALVEVAEVRKRAARRFANAEVLFFTGEMLAQASSPAISAYHAQRLLTFETVADLGCGAGMDSVAFAQAGLAVCAVERDPVRLVFARANAEALGLLASGDRLEAGKIVFRQADVTQNEWSANAAFFDPARRTDGKRHSRHAEQYEPSLSFLEAIRARVQAGCVKLSPALPDEVLQGLGGTVEFLSEGRECKEACVWFGKAQTAGKPMSAVLLSDGLTFATTELPPVAAQIGAYLYDPDPALVRAGATSNLPGAERISGADAYLTGDSPLTPTRAAQSYRVLESHVYRPQTWKLLLRARNINRLVIKKRYFPQEPLQIHKELGLSGKGEEGTLVLVRDGKRFIGVLCEPV